jgi:hypothetical protein
LPSPQRGKNGPSQKDWGKRDEVPFSQVHAVLVQSRDRRVFRFDVLDESGSVLLRVDKCDSKASLDDFLRDLSKLAPHVELLLAHPSHGIADPAVEWMTKLAREAEALNASERRRRERIQREGKVQVRSYTNHRAYEADAPRMAKARWFPQGETGARGGASIGGTAGKAVLTIGLGLITGFSRKADAITVTWVREADALAERPLKDVPKIPQARSFPPEPYFGATNLQVVEKGEEFPPLNSAQPTAMPVSLALSAPDESGANPRAESEEDALDTLAMRLRKVEDLHAAGIITDEERSATRSQILNDL